MAWSECSSVILGKSHPPFNIIKSPRNILRQIQAYNLPGGKILTPKLSVKYFILRKFDAGVSLVLKSYTGIYHVYIVEVCENHSGTLQSNNSACETIKLKLDDVADMLVQNKNFKLL